MALLAFALGLRHGLDADHLATIDGFARVHAGVCPRLARCSGLLFSLGHGSVVIAIATLAALGGESVVPPPWLATSGALVSIGFLLLLGGASLHSAWQGKGQGGLKVRLLPFFAHGPAGIAGAGLLFAFSFDTMSQAVFFSLAGPWGAAMLALLFMLGMMASDSLNGLWTAWLLRRAGNAAELGARIMAALVGALSVAVALLGIARLSSTDLAGRLDGLGLWAGAGVLLFMLSGYGLARWGLARWGTKRDMAHA